MTEKEIDTYLVTTLNKILMEETESFKYINSKSYIDFASCQKKNKKNLDLLTRLCKSIKTVDDLADCQDDVIDAVYDMIFDYASNFTIRQDAAYKESDEAEYENLEELLFLFIDEDEDSEEDE